MTLKYLTWSMYFILLLSVTSAVRGSFINTTDGDNDDDDEKFLADSGFFLRDAVDDAKEKTVLTDNQNNIEVVSSTTEVPPEKSGLPVVKARTSDDPLKITLWAAVSSKITSHTERERLLMMGMLRPPLALQKTIVVAHVDPGKNNMKTLKSFEFNAKIDPDD